MCGIGGSEQSGQQVIQQNNEPWSGQRPHLENVFSRAEDLSNTPTQYYPNSTVVPHSNQTTTALGLAENRAMNGSPLLQAGQDAVQATAAGDFLGASNPHFNSMVNAAADPIIERFNEDILPGVTGQFARSGRFGSGAHERAVERATGQLTDSLTNMSGGLAFQNHGMERGLQMQASQLAPSMAQADYFDIGQLQNVGAAHERLAGSQLQDDINRHNFSQTEERQRLGDYAALVAGGSFGGSSTQTAPIYSNPTANTLGTIGMGLNIANGVRGLLG